MTTTTLRIFTLADGINTASPACQLDKIETFLKNNPFALSLHACAGEWQLCYQQMDGCFPSDAIGEDELAHCENREMADEAFRSLLRADKELADFVGACQDLIVSTSGHQAYLSPAHAVDIHFHEQTHLGITGEIETAGCPEKLQFKLRAGPMTKHPLRMAFLRFAHLLLSQHSEVEAITIADRRLCVKCGDSNAATEALEDAIETLQYVFKRTVLFPIVHIGLGLTVARHPFTQRDYLPDTDNFDWSYSTCDCYIHTHDLPWIREIIRKGHGDAGKEVYAQLRFKQQMSMLQSLYKQVQFI